jgi:hypothetical protein
VVPPGYISERYNWLCSGFDRPEISIYSVFICPKLFCRSGNNHILNQRKINRPKKP